MRSSPLPKVVFAMAVFCLGAATSAHALSVQAKNIFDDQPATGLRFGVLDATVTHHEAQQYLEVTHSASVHRKVYLYTTNGASFGVPQAGLVSVGSLDPLPFFFRNFDNRPPIVSFSPAEEPFWVPVIESSATDFATAKQASARLLPGPDGLSFTFFGVKVPPPTRGGAFRARLLLEESSDVPDIAGPAIDHRPFNDVILIDIPVGIETALSDDSLVVGSTVCYRMVTTPPVAFSSATASLTQDPGDPFRWKAGIELFPGINVHAPGVLEYYFLAVDTFTNRTESPHFRANLVPATEATARPLPVEGGDVEIAVGDPRLPGVRLLFPSGSLSGGGTLTVRLKDETTTPPFQESAPVRVFDLGPNGLRFQSPITIELPYLDRDQNGWVDGSSVNETDLRVFWFDGFSWRFVGGKVDPEANRVSATVTHFSEYGLFSFGQAPSAEVVRPLERILTPNPPNDALHFNTTAANGDFDIDIFDIGGARVRRIHNIPEWDRRDDSGRVVESGTYVYRFSGQGMTLTGMIALAR